MADNLYEDIENKILKITSEMVNQGNISDEEAGEINSLAREGEIDEALDLIEQHQEEEEEDLLEFSDEEKDVFAEAFQEDFQKLLDNIEQMKESLTNLENGASRSDFKQYLYGANSSRTYDEIDKVFSAIDDFSSSGISDKKIAKVLTAFSSSLTIKQTEKMISEIREKATEVEGKE